MKIIFLSVGKMNDDYVQKGVEMFTQRIQKYFPVEWQLIATPKNAATLPIAILKKKEADLIISQLHEGDYVVLLDERGTQQTSPEVANRLQRCGNASSKRIVFVIGGAFGVDGSVAKRANYIWSVSKLVFPHQFVRLLLSEQIYRACTILNNEQYHHD